MPAIRKGYRRPGRVVLPRRLPVGCGRDGGHRGGQCPAKRWCARRTLPKNNRLRMCVGAPCAPRGFCRPGRGPHPCRFPEGRGRDWYDREGQGPAKGPTHPGVGCVGAKNFSPLQRRALWARMYTARQGTETRSFLSCSAEKGHDMGRTGWSPCRAGRGGAGMRPHLRFQ